MSSETKTVDQYLTFFIGGEEYAVGILQVTDIIECGPVTKVPGAPTWIRGVHNLRGAVVPVVDLAIKFGLPPTEITRRTCIVIVEVHIDDARLVMGVMAESVHQVIDLTPAQIQPPPAFGPRVRIDCLLGVCQGAGKFALLLDIDRVLSSNELLATTSVTDDEQAAPEAQMAVAE